MLKPPISKTPTERVVARLTSEGWIYCPNLGFPALCQQPLSDLREYVLQQLRQAGNRMWEDDLQVSTLVFSISAHEFQVHPHLKAVLKQLESEGVIEQYEVGKSAQQGKKAERAILLKTLNVV